MIFTQEDPPTAAVLFREFKQLGGQYIPWIGTDVTSGSDYLKAIGYQTAHAQLTSVYGTSVTGAANTAFISLFNKIYPSQKTAGPLANANYAYDAVISLALADDYAKTTNGTTVGHDMTKVTNPPGTACYTYASCLRLLKAGHEDQLRGGERQPRLQPVQQHVRPLWRLPGHPGRRGAAGLRDVGQRARGRDTLPGPGPGPAAAGRAGHGHPQQAAKPQGCDGEYPAGPLAAPHVPDLARVLAADDC